MAEVSADDASNGSDVSHDSHSPVYRPKSEVFYQFLKLQPLTAVKTISMPSVSEVDVLSFEKSFFIESRATAERY